MADFRRIVIGLEGTQPLELRVTDDVLEQLRGALASAGGEGKQWHDVATQETDVHVDLSKVLYVSVASQEHRVGF